MTNIKPDGFRPGSINHEKSKKHDLKKTEPEKAVEIKKETDLRNDPTQILGRSQVQKSKKIDTKKFDPELVKNIAGDLDVLRKNPKLVLGSEKVFNNNYAKAENYSEAADMQARFVEEFSDSKD